MTYFDYRVVPAPKRLKRIKGVKSTGELFAATLSETINAVAREGWEYVRSETLPAAEEGGWLRRRAEVVETVLVFRRPREHFAPRLAVARAEEEPEYEPAPRTAAAERQVQERERPLAAAPIRREPRFGDVADTASPLRPTPRLGPADQG